MPDKSRVEKKTVFPTGPDLKNARASNGIVFMAKSKHILKWLYILNECLFYLGNLKNWQP